MKPINTSIFDFPTLLAKGGVYVDSKGDKVQERKRQCRACKGTGKAGTRKNARPCKRCGGTGEETAGVR